MKEEIRGIIADNTSFDFELQSITIDPKIADDLEKYFKDFLLWCLKGDKFKVNYGNEETPFGISVEDYTIDQVYEKWLKEK